MSVEETLWRQGRRGGLLRPFCERAAVNPCGRSRRLQRALVDFGAEESFARAAQRVHEHYGLDVHASVVRRHTFAHGVQINALKVIPPKHAVPTLITQLDGSMIPIVVPSEQGEDARRGKQLLWREARLCLARAKNSTSPCYAATLGGVQLTGVIWRDTALAVGLSTSTHVHGVGDGAPWILAQFQEHFGEQGDYLVDFYHVSEYLAAAAAVIAPDQPEAWRHTQQGHLLDNQVSEVLKALESHLETEATKPSPVRDAHRYLNERREHLDYAGARAAGLEIGSGEIESGHRHVIQKRLKLAGCWWKETNADTMLGLRTARANQLWNRYWLIPNPTLN